MNKILVLLFTGAFLFLGIGEGNTQSKGYIVKGDSAFIEGKIIFDFSNPKEVEFHSGKGGIQKLNANQLSEFGFVNGSIYKSRKIPSGDEEQTVFLELVVEGKVKLFRLPSGKSTFFLEDSSLVKLEKNNYQNILEKYTNECSKWKKQRKLVSYGENSLTHFMRQYNLNKCQNLPFYSYGLIVEYSFFRMRFPGNSLITQGDEAVRINSSGFSFGFFTETPIWKLDNISFLSEIRLGRQKFIKELFSTNLNKDIKIETTSLSLNFAPKYTFNKEEFRPYFFLGGSLNYNLKSTSEIFRAVIKEELISFEKVYDSIDLPEFYYGISYGAGVQFFYRYDHYINFEINNENLFSYRSITLGNIHFSIKANL